MKMNGTFWKGFITGVGIAAIAVGGLTLVHDNHMMQMSDETFNINMQTIELLDGQVSKYSSMYINEKNANRELSDRIICANFINGLIDEEEFNREMEMINTRYTPEAIEDLKDVREQLKEINPEAQIVVTLQYGDVPAIEGEGYLEDYLPTIVKITVPTPAPEKTDAGAKVKTIGEGPKTL